MADLKVCKSPDGLTTLGLGSCIGVALRDPNTKIGGLLHFMLPDSSAIKNNTCAEKFADTGIELLVKLMIAEGASKHRLEAKIAGGAQMFSFQNKEGLLRVGERNAEAARKKLKAMNIKLLAEDVGADYGRTVVFYPETGEYVIKSVGKPQKSI